MFLGRCAVERLVFQEINMSNQIENRKNAVVNKHVQHMLAGRVVLHFFIFICAGAIFGIINQFLMNPFDSVQENLTVFARHSAPFLVALVCLIPIFVRDTLTLSNRIAGPIHNLRKTIQRHVDGESDIKPLRFRKKDFWPDLPDAFNTMIENSKAAKADRDQQQLMEV